MNTITIDLVYWFKGSSNSKLTLTQQRNGYIKLISQYGKHIVTVDAGYALMRVLNQLINGDYA